MTCRHASDCAVHNAPALPVGECGCGADGLTSEDRAALDRLKAAIAARNAAATMMNGATASVQGAISELAHAGIRGNDLLELSRLTSVFLSDLQMPLKIEKIFHIWIEGEAHND